MEVQAHNFDLALDIIRLRLLEAKFLAVDLEFTGVTAAGEADSYADQAVERLEKCCRIVECYAPIQLGITICSTENELSSFSIMMAPEWTFLCELAALKFVCKHVDLNAWVDQGVRYVSREEVALPAGPAGCRDDLLKPMLRLHAQACGSSFLCQASCLRAERESGLDLGAWVEGLGEIVGEDDVRRFTGPDAPGPAASHEDLALRTAGLPRLWQALKDAGKPVVVHGMMDVLFLLAAFEQRVLPRDHAKLTGLVKECFPGGIYDTAFLHESLSGLRLCPLRLYSFMKSAKDHHVKRHGGELQLTLEEFTEQRYGYVFRNEGDELTHEAGYDSFLTAVLFSYLQESYRVPAPSVYRFYLHKSTDSVNLGGASTGKGAFVSKIYESDRLVVARMRDKDARENTTKRISEARRSERENAFFYRKMEDDSLLIPGCTQAKLVQLSAMLPGVEWTDFYTWQKQVRQDRNAREQSADRRFIGAIKSFCSEKGYGFISSSECFRIYERDVYLHQVQIGILQEDRLVSFSVVCNKKGQPQARQVRECWCTGVVRTWVPERCQGTISCPGTFRIFGSNVLFCGSAQTDALQVGEQVSFTLDFRQGQLVVRQIARAPPRTAPPSARPPEAQQDRRLGVEEMVDPRVVLTDMLVAGKSPLVLEGQAWKWVQ
mmetsp:Transcript_109884/g.342517  ORF Transcript_109884/g.342517 Transcript_109884/m.342517 type:complete len:661 (+) Transcript_109884:174-2156(+)